jgi:hypothetical protein
MDQTAHVIRDRIEEQREELAGNIRELETRVKSATDWRAQFQRNPTKLLGIALTAGLALGWLTRPHDGGELRNCRCHCE